MNKLIKVFKCYFGLFVLASLCSPVHAQSNITLHDSLNAALEKHPISASKSVNNFSTTDGLSSWISGAPSISLMRLQSDETLGTTESEVSLNFAIKPRFLKELEQQVQSGVTDVRKTAQRQYALYLSGLIRELLWTLEIEEILFDTSSVKNELLSTLVTKYTDMANAQAIPQYLLLIVQNELNQLALSSQEHQKKIENLRAQYFRLTSLRVMPQQITEVPLAGEQIDLKFHPDIQALDAAYESSKHQLASTGKDASSWNLNVSGRRVSTNSFSENQLGVGIEIPISFGNNLSSIQQSEHSLLTAEYEVSRKTRMTQLSEAHIAMVREHAFLKSKQQLLDKGEGTLSALSEAMNELIEANAPNQEFYVRTLLNNIDSKKEREVNSLLIQRQIALIRQAAGKSL